MIGEHLSELNALRREVGELLGWRIVSSKSGYDVLTPDGDKFGGVPAVVPTIDDAWGYVFHLWINFCEYGTNMDHTLTLLTDEGAGGPFAIGFNPSMNDYWCEICNTNGTLLIKERGKAVSIAICNAWIAWKKSQQSE